MPKSDRRSAPCGPSRDEIEPPPEADADVQQQGNLQIHGTYGEPLVCAAGARETDARFDVEGQTAVEQDLVRHSEVEARARTGIYPHVFDRDVVGRHVDAGTDAQDVFLVPLRPGGSRRQQDEEDECVSFHGG